MESLAGQIIKVVLHHGHTGPCRSGRDSLQWSQNELAERASIDVTAVQQLETGEALPQATLNAVRKAFEKAGITLKQNLERPRQSDLASRRVKVNFLARVSLRRIWLH